MRNGFSPQQRERSLVADLPGALSRGEIVAFYQPQIEVATGRVVALEGLSRWSHPRWGMIGPCEFIPIAEEIGLIHEVGAFMLEEGCRYAAEWQHRGRPIEIAVNVSGYQFSRLRFFEDVVALLDRFSLDPCSLTLEITESRVIDDLATVTELLGGLRELGIGISIDDFGVGHSSIDRLLMLRATELKIDRTLVQDRESHTRSLVGAVVSLVRERGLRVVAEGVETAADLEFVREIHCERAQGFLFGRPEPRAQLEGLILAG